MKKFFSLFVIAGVAVIALVVFYLNHHAEQREKEIKEKLSVAKKAFSDKETKLYVQGTPEEYGRAQNEAMQAYKAELAAIAKIDENVLDLEAEKKKWKEADEKKPPSEEQKKLREEYYNTTRAAYDALLSGTYKPVLTAPNSGARLDVTSLKRVQTAEGEVLRADFIAWGFPPEVAWGDINMVVWVSKEATDPKAKKKGEKVDEIKYKFDASSARPTIVINNPERWIKSFPPGATLGYYYLQLMPRDSEKLDLSFHYRMTMDGGRIANVDVAFEKLPVTEALMLAQGAKFEAMAKESSDEERQGKPETTEVKKK